MKALDLIGQRFTRLMVVSRANNSLTGKTRWNCVEVDIGIAISKSSPLKKTHENETGRTIIPRWYGLISQQWRPLRK